MADKFTISEEAYKNGYDKGYEQGKKDAIKHGRPKPRFICPFCYDTRIARFCSNCGAKMDWEEVENVKKCTDN